MLKKLKGEDGRAGVVVQLVFYCRWGLVLGEVRQSGDPNDSKDVREALWVLSLEVHSCRPRLACCLLGDHGLDPAWDIEGS